MNEKIKDGLHTEWDENGEKKSEGIYKNGKLDGLWVEWYENGQKDYEQTYKDGRYVLGSTKVWNEDGSVWEK